MLKKIIFIGVLASLLLGCASVEKYNAHISKDFTPEELKEDVDFAHKLLTKYHPDLYWYITKDSLDGEFENLKNNLDKPMTGQEFYRAFAPVINSIRQGHASIRPVFKKQTKEEKKEKGKRTSPFRKIRFRGIDGHVFIEKIFSKDSLKVGSEVLNINEIETSTLLDSYRELITGDGYNTTFYPELSGYAFGSYFTKLYGVMDSIHLNLKFNDSLYSYNLKADYAKLKPKTNDSLKQEKKEVEKLSKKERKAKDKWERIHGYDKFTKEQTRSLEFLPIDSTQVAAYMKIRRFKNGDYKTFYEQSFKAIDSAKTNFLILDLRDNFGGSLREIGILNAYLTNQDEYIMVEPAKMTKRTSYFYPFTHTPMHWFNGLMYLTSPVHTLYIQAFKIKTIDGKPYFNYKMAKPRKAHEFNFKGKLYVIINGNSFSASSTLGAHLDGTNRAIFVGEETGGAYNGTIAGMMPIVALPNSKLKLRFGFMNIKTPYSQKPDGYGVKPDVYVPNTSIEQDEQLDWIINNIKQTLND